MPYPPNAAVNIDQYLKTATAGKVRAEFAVDTQRWRLICDHCGKKLTFNDTANIEEEYTKSGMLDWNVQTFAKEHLHMKPEMNKWGTVVFAPEKTPETKSTEIQMVASKLEFAAWQLTNNKQEISSEGYKKLHSQLKAMKSCNEEKIKELQKLKFMQSVADTNMELKALQSKPVKEKPEPPKPKIEGRKFR